MAMRQLQDKNGNVIHMTSEMSIFNFKERFKNAIWGDHFRVMKRRRDDPSVVAKCPVTGHKLIETDYIGKTRDEIDQIMRKKGQV
jgi:hypothetical protein